MKYGLNTAGGGEYMALVNIAGCVIDTNTAAALIKIIKEIPAEKRGQVLEDKEHSRLLRYQLF